MSGLSVFQLARISARFSLVFCSPDASSASGPECTTTTGSLVKAGLGEGEAEAAGRRMQPVDGHCYWAASIGVLAMTAPADDAGALGYGYRLPVSNFDWGL
jgi:hypothetical protein